MQNVHSNSSPGFLPAHIGNSPVTMSSREIAELVNSRHDDVKRSIDRLVERGVIVQPPMADEHGTDALGRPRVTQVYRIGKRDSYVIVAQLSPEFTARLVDRWQELEEGRAKAVPASAGVKELAAVFSGCKQIAKLAGLKGNQSILSAAHAARKITGTDPLALIGVTYLDAPQNEALLNPSDIGERLGGLTGQKVNAILTEEGFQTQHRDRKKRVYYEPTPKGEASGAVMQDTGKKKGDGTPIRQLRWASRIVDVMRSIIGGRA